MSDPFELSETLPPTAAQHADVKKLQRDFDRLVARVVGLHPGLVQAVTLLAITQLTNAFTDWNIEQYDRAQRTQGRKGPLL